MRRAVVFVLASVASLLLYLVVFSVVERPLTLGDLNRQLDYKLAYARTLQSPKVVLFAGSNGRYSHRCAEFSDILQMPCVNAAVASGIGIDFQLAQLEPLLKPGDLVYMPLEYAQYGVTEPQMHQGVQNAVVLRHRPEYLWAQPWSRIIDAYGAFDLPFLLRGAAEMALTRVSFQRRSGLDTLTPQGDEDGHTALKGAAYRDAILKAPLPETHVPAASYAQDVLIAFLKRARMSGVSVVGGLPTVPSATSISDADVGRIRDLFETHGQGFVVIPSKSRYAADCFYDGPYHLNAECQIEHSRLIAEALRRSMSRPRS